MAVRVGSYSYGKKKKNHSSLVPVQVCSVIIIITMLIIIIKVFKDSFSKHLTMRTVSPAHANNTLSQLLFARIRMKYSSVHDIF